MARRAAGGSGRAPQHRVHAAGPGLPHTGGTVTSALIAADSGAALRSACPERSHPPARSLSPLRALRPQFLLFFPPPPPPGIPFCNRMTTDLQRKKNTYIYIDIRIQINTRNAPLGSPPPLPAIVPPSPTPPCGTKPRRGPGRAHRPGVLPSPPSPRSLRRVPGKGLRTSGGRRRRRCGTAPGRGKAARGAGGGARPQRRARAAPRGHPQPPPTPTTACREPRARGEEGKGVQGGGWGRPRYLALPGLGRTAPHEALVNGPQVLLPVLHLEAGHMAAPGRRRTHVRPPHINPPADGPGRRAASRPLPPLGGGGRAGTGTGAGTARGGRAPPPATPPSLRAAAALRGCGPSSRRLPPPPFPRAAGRAAGT